MEMKKLNSIKAIKLDSRNINMKKYVEERKLYEYDFLEGKRTQIYYTDINDPLLKEGLEWVSKGINNDLIALDLEFEAKTAEMRLLQIGTDRRAIIIRYISKQNDRHHKIIKNFLKEHKFIGKGTGLSDLVVLEKRFGYDFSNNINDFEMLYMKRDIRSFEYMIQRYAEKPTLEYYKGHGKGKWDDEKLRMKKILYSAFDVVGLYSAFKGAKKAHPKIDPLVILPSYDPKISYKDYSFGIGIICLILKSVNVIVNVI